MNAADHDLPLAGPSAEEPRLTLAEAATLPARERSIVASQNPTLDDGRSEDEPVGERPPSSPGEPQRLGRYVVLGTLGHGGMGTVLEAFDRTLDRRVAVKILHHELGQRHTRRLLREAQAMAKLSHPNVVQVYEAGEVDGQRFIAMELVRGQTLQGWIEQDPRPGWRRCVETFLQVGAGLSAAHAQGLVHRDFKPSNAIVDPDGRARVLDFGLARQVEGGKTLGGEDDEQGESPEALDGERSPSVPELDPDSASELELAALHTPLTRTGAVLGTPAYMPPEQMKGREVDARSDQFSFCVSLYEALYGERPFEGGSIMSIMVSMTTGHVRAAPKGTNVPAKLRQVVLRGLSLEPDARHPSMDALLAELRRLVTPVARRWLPLGLVGGLVAIGLGLAYWAEVSSRCDGAAAQLDGVWDEARKQELRDAILGTELSYAGDTWERVEARLDARAEAWVAMRTDVCEATNVRKEQSSEVMDLRMTCLDRQRIELRATVDVLTAVDATRVEKATTLVEGLPTLTRCEDVEALAATRAELPPPADPELAAAVEVQREALVKAAARLEGGDARGSLAQAEAVAEVATTLGYAPLEAEALLRRGLARERVDQLDGAEADLERAYHLALAHEHEEVELEAATGLVLVVGGRRARYERAGQWGAVAVALAERRGTPDTAKSNAIASAGIVLLEQARLPEALERFERARAIDEAARGPDHPRVALDLTRIGTVLRQQGKPDEALVCFEQALAIQQAALGPGHPHVALTLSAIGSLLSDQGQADRGLEHQQRSLAIQEAALGSRSHAVAGTLANIGAALGRQGQLEGALEHFRRSLEIMEETVGPRHPRVAATLGNIGVVLHEQGKLDEALAHHQRALGILEDVLGPRHRDVAATLDNIGVVLQRQGKLDEALAHHERALAIFSEAMGSRHHTVALAFERIGAVRRARDDLDAAKAAYEQALAIAEERDAHHPEVVGILVGLSGVELSRNEVVAARSHAERATAIAEASQVMPTLVAKARFTLALALVDDPSQSARARALAEQARDVFGVHEGHEAEHAEVAAWLAEVGGG